MNISGTEQVALAGMVLSFFCLYGRNRGSFFGSLDSQVQSRLTLGTGGQDFLGANLPLDRVQTYLGRASGHGSSGPDSPPLHTARAHPRQETAGRFQRHATLPWGVCQALVAAASWVQNDKVGFNRCPRNNSNYTCIYIALCLQRAKHPFILFFLKKSLLNYFSDDQSNTYSTQTTQKMEVQLRKEIACNFTTQICYF